jgi:uncharacterized membrane protein
MQRVITHRKHTVNITQAERIVSAIGGGLLASVGLKRRTPGGIALALLGGDLLRRGITGHCYAYQALGIRTAEKGQGADTTSVPYELGVRVDKSITIARPPHEVYTFWRDLNNLARFMKNVESVTDLGNGKSHWVVKAPAGRKVEWDAIIHNEEEGRMISWRTLEGAAVQHAGSVWFKEAPAGRGTEVRIEMQYNPPAGMLGAAVATLWRKDPGSQMQEDLHRLKQILEAGEIPTTQGQPRGRHGAAPDRDGEVHQASVESFPASDAPVYNR